MSRHTRRARAQPLAERLHAAAIHLLRLVRKVDAEAGLGPAKLSALSVLVFGGPMSPGQLAAAEQVRPPSMTRIVQELEGEGYVRRSAEPSDRRVVRLEATRKGARVMMAGRARRAALLTDWLSRLGDAELADLERGLPVIEAAIRLGRSRATPPAGFSPGPRASRARRDSTPPPRRR